MEKYNEDRPCKKCGGTNASTNYVKRWYNDDTNQYEYELMVRKCPRCGHKWKEHALDSNEEE